MNGLAAVHWIDLHPHLDSRGSLTAIEGGHAVPFEIKRVYFLRGVTSDRAGHAHRDTEQLIIPLVGHFVVTLSDGRETRRFFCDDPARGLYIVPMLFIRLTEFTSDAVALVLASTHYDKSRSLRSWEDYLATVTC
jgi:hypothetical protein